MGRKLYKVLEDGRSCSGGHLSWSVPTQDESGEWQPGDWHEVEGELQLCKRGLHLTWDPAQWYAQGRDVYECEAERLGEETDDAAKIVVGRARLTRRLSDEELAELRIYRYGEHEIHEGACHVSGSASVRARGSASVEARGSASVEAYEVSTIIAHWGSATVALRDRAVLVDQRGKKPVVRIAGQE